MVDNTLFLDGLTDDQALLCPEELKGLSDEQRVEFTKYLVEKINASDELLGAITRKVRQIKKDTGNC